MDYETAEEIKRHFNVVAEGLRSDIRLVIEGLGANTDRLDRLQGRFDGLEGRFEGLEIRFEGLEGRFEGLEIRFEYLRTEFRELKERIEPLLTRGDN